MKLISGIRIKGFRSIQDSAKSLDSLDNFCSFAGLNNSGKSNVLRALNAFFTGYTDQLSSLAFNTDYCRHFLNSKKKNKSIEITVNFVIPDNFKFRKELTGAKTLIGSKCSISKRWTNASIAPDYFLNSGKKPLSHDDKLKIDQFLGLINFRYIPNRVLPIQLIKNEHQALRDTLVRRLGKKGKQPTEAFDVIQSTSDKLIEGFSNRIKGVVGNIDDIRLATPKTWADLIFAFGYRLTSNGVEIDDDAQGSGIQSLLMLETLYLIDKDYFQKFGWKQAAIWAMEEPESSLHSSMEAQVASFLSTISSDAKSRLQVFITTHSDLMIQYSDKPILVEIENSQTLFHTKLSKREILAKSSQLGISRFVHPVLYHPLEPIIIVDGKYDKAFLDEVFRLQRVQSTVEIVYLEQLDAGKTGGEGDILGYIKGCRSAIRSRTKSSPVVILLDWESRKMDEFKKLTKGLDDRLLIFQCPENGVNPKLDKSFAGMERFYSDRLIGIADGKCPNKIATKSNGIKSIHPTDYEDVKRTLYEEIKANGLVPDDIVHIRSFIADVIGVLKQP